MVSICSVALFGNTRRNKANPGAIKQIRLGHRKALGSCAFDSRTPPRGHRTGPPAMIRMGRHWHRSVGWSLRKTLLVASSCTDCLTPDLGHFDCCRHSEHRYRSCHVIIYEYCIEELHSTDAVESSRVQSHAHAHNGGTCMTRVRVEG